MRLYVDQVGVLADWDKGVAEHYGQKHCDEIADDFWNKACVSDMIFARLPVIEEGLRMLQDLRDAGLKPCILTSTGGGRHHYQIARQKLIWLEDNGVRGLPVTFAMSTSGKADFAAPGDILIDDRQKVVDAWAAAGGHGILFTRDSADLITSLVKGMVKHVTYK